MRNPVNRAPHRVKVVLNEGFEFSPLKNRCLTQCSSPVAFNTSHWRPGLSGAVRMGLTYGTFCVECCWALMLLLFTAGVMNLIWVATLAVLILAQKVVPYTRAATRMAGVAMAVVGLVLLLR